MQSQGARSEHQKPRRHSIRGKETRARTLVCPRLCGRGELVRPAGKDCRGQPSSHVHVGRETRQVRAETPCLARSSLRALSATFWTEPATPVEPEPPAEVVFGGAAEVVCATRVVVTGGLEVTLLSFEARVVVGAAREVVVRRRVVVRGWASRLAFSAAEVAAAREIDVLCCAGTAVLPAAASPP